MLENMPRRRWVIRISSLLPIFKSLFPFFPPLRTPANSLTHMFNSLHKFHPEPDNICSCNWMLFPHPGQETTKRTAVSLKNSTTMFSENGFSGQAETQLQDLTAAHVVLSVNTSLVVSSCLLAFYYVDPRMSSFFYFYIFPEWPCFLFCHKIFLTGGPEQMNGNKTWLRKDKEKHYVFLWTKIMLKIVLNAFWLLLFLCFSRILQVFINYCRHFKCIWLVCQKAMYHIVFV